MQKKISSTVTIIGTGQTGIAAAYYLKKYNIPYVLLDEGSYVGETWDKRYDSLTLDSLRKYSRLLKKYPFPGNPNNQPTKNEVVTYLQNIVSTENIEPLLQQKVTSVHESSVNNSYLVETTDLLIESTYIIIATGAFNREYIPFSDMESFSGIHSKYYQNPEQINAQDILIVGSGNSAVEIAHELLDAGKKVTIASCGKKLPSLHNSKLSQWIAYVLGVAHVPFWHPVGFAALMYTKGKSIGDDADYIQQHKNCTIVDAVKQIDSKHITLADDTPLPHPEQVIWATGYRPAYPWLQVDDMRYKENGEIKHLHGKTKAKNIFVLGQRWQYSKSSSHITGVSRDALVITNLIRLQEKIQ